VRVEARIVAVAVLAAASCVSAQQQSEEVQIEQNARRRVDALSERLTFVAGDVESQRRFYAEMDKVANSVRDEIDGFLSTTVRPLESSPAAEKKLRAVLGGHQPEKGWGDPPSVWIEDLRNGKAMVAAYTLAYSVGRRPHGNQPTIRGYREDSNGRFRFVASSMEFESSTMHLRKMASPIGGEMWFLGWGGIIGANGNSLVVRVLAFDGTDFRTVWSPHNFASGKVELTPGGFAISHLDRESGLGEVRDEYTLTVDGADRITRR
jgi:hypothetical protein